MLLWPGENAGDGFCELMDFDLETLVLRTLCLKNRHEDRGNGIPLRRPILCVLIFGQFPQANPRSSGSGFKDLGRGIGELRGPTWLNALAIGEYNLDVKNRHTDHRFIVDEVESSRRLR